MLCAAVPFIENVEMIRCIMRFCGEFVNETDDLEMVDKVNCAMQHIIEVYGGLDCIE
jgi:hypothetical protein